MKKISKSLFLALCVSALPQLASAQDRGQPQSNGRPAPEQTPRPAPAPAPAPAAAPAPTRAKNQPAPAVKVEPTKATRHAPAAQTRTGEKQGEHASNEPVVDRHAPAAQRSPQDAGQAQGQAQGQDQRVENARQDQKEQRIHNAREQQKQEEQRAQEAREQQKQHDEQRIQNARDQQRQEEQRAQNARADAKGGADDVTGQPPETVFRKFKLEEAKHRDRVARIAALRRLANARQNQEQVASLDRLLERENQQYSEWIRRTRSALGPEEFEAQRARLDGRAVRKPEGATQKRPAEQPAPPARPQ